MGSQWTNTDKQAQSVPRQANQQQPQSQAQPQASPLGLNLSRSSAMGFSRTGLMDDGIISNKNRPIVSQASSIIPINDGFVKSSIPTDTQNSVVGEPKPIKPSMTIHDGIAKAKNQPMVMPAGKITPINDGLVKSDPKDVAIFAKEGGVIGNFLADLKSSLDYVLRGRGSTQSNEMKIEISGSLELSSGGQSINIIEEFNRNPILLRSFTKMLAQQFSSNKNGGRTNSQMNNFD